MTVDSWQPTPAPAPSISAEQIAQLNALAEKPFTQSDVEPQLDWIEPLARSEKAIWASVAESLSEVQLRHLIQFFTLLEESLSLDLGSKSPVIPLFKALKKQVGIDRDLVQWVKANTQNKFLPFGPLG